MVREIQRALKEKGFPPGPIDGDFGPSTHAAVVSLQASRGLVIDGEVGARTARALGVKLPAADPKRRHSARSGFALTSPGRRRRLVDLIPRVALRRRSR